MSFFIRKMLPGAFPKGWTTAGCLAKYLRMDLESYSATAAAERQARIFKVLSVGARVRIIALLRQRMYCVNALAGALGITPAAVSQHLRVLRDAGVVTPTKSGLHVHYRVNEATLRQWADTARALLEGGR